MLSAKKELFTPSGGGYQISRSVRLRSAATAYFTRTPSVASNQKTFTLSMWVKRGALTGDNTMFCVRAVGVSAPYWYVTFDNSTNVLSLNSSAGGALYTTQLFRDTAAWQHIIYAVDTTQATASNRTKLYINGSQVTALSTATYPALNADVGVNSTTQHWVGCGTNGAGTIAQYYDGYITEVNLIDGQALTPSSFGETDVVTGVWKPKKYAGTYGTNGFYLNFSDNSGATATTIGKDNSGNGNNWTPNNISVTAGATYDSMTDVPTLTSATAANFAVLSPIDKGSEVTLANANLSVSWSGVTGHSVRATMGCTSGQWYWEVTSGANASIGLINFALPVVPASGNVWPGGSGFGAGGSYAYAPTGLAYTNNTGTSYGASFTTGDVIGVAFDSSAGTLTFYKNGVSQGVAYTGISTSIVYAPAIGYFQPSSGTQNSFNFGQRPFAYTPPTGFKALNTQNLPDAPIKKGNAHFDATTYTGTGASQSIVNSGAMQPDWVWFNRRNTAENHWLVDAIRGVSNGLFSNLTNVETSQPSTVSSFNSNGFTVGADTTGYTNANGSTYVAWQWNGGGSTVTNTSGTISAQVRANPTAGFSVVTYTGNGLTNQSVGHGLNATPGMVIIKQRDGTANWLVHHQSQPTGYTVYLNLTNAQDSGTSQWGTSAQTSSLFYVGYTAGATGSNVNASTYVAYCFAPVAGYSAFGSYTGNGSTDGPFIYTGFRPRWVMIKITSTTGNWFIQDSSTNTSNIVTKYLYADSSAAEATNGLIDFLSNGFKLRNTYAAQNPSGGTIIYAAFAENPFKNSLAR